MLYMVSLDPDIYVFIFPFLFTPSLPSSEKHLLRFPVMLQLCWGPLFSVDGYLKSSSPESDFAWESAGLQGKTWLLPAGPALLRGLLSPSGCGFFSVSGFQQVNDGVLPVRFYLSCLGV